MQTLLYKIYSSEIQRTKQKSLPFVCAITKFSERKGKLYANYEMWIVLNTKNHQNSLHMFST